MFGTHAYKYVQHTTHSLKHPWRIWLLCVLVVRLPALAYSWNIFRYVGDYLHLFGVIALLITIAKNKSVAGISRSTQILYFLVFVTRYLDLFDHTQTSYLVFFKPVDGRSRIIPRVLAP